MITVVSKHLSRELIPRLTPLTRSLTFLNVLEIDEDGIEYFNPQVLVKGKYSQVEYSQKNGREDLFSVFNNH